MSGDSYHLWCGYDTYAYASLSLQDCALYTARLQMDGPPEMVFGLTNNLFHRITSAWFSGEMTLFMFNNLVQAASDWSMLASDYGEFTAYDNVFEETVLSDWGDDWPVIEHSHNAYIRLPDPTYRLNPPNSTDVVLANFTYASGPLGDYYQVSEGFRDAGSRTAAEAGLYHYTTQADQTKDALPKVNIGLHYVALDGTLATSQPVDSDADGVADWLEDLNGNGVQDIGETSVTRQDSPFVRRHEPLGPSSRRTPLIISEIMYNPAGSQNYEFIELYNTHHLPIDLSDYQLRFDEELPSAFTFPASTILAPNAFLLIARNPAYYPQVQNKVGPYANNLPNGGGRIQVISAQGAILLDVEYDDDALWPVQADGAGHSLVLANPSYGENDPRAWAASQWCGGSPGVAEENPADPLNAIKINEFLAYPPGGQEDFIELYNACNQYVDISGCGLWDMDNANEFFRIPAGTVLAPLGFIHFVRDQPGSFEFGLASGGDDIFLFNPEQTRVLDAVRFAGQQQGISTGRTPDGAPTFSELTERTPGTANSPALTRDIVINEIMFNPISGDDNHEYIENL